MRPLSRIGWFTLGLGLVILGIIFLAHGGEARPFQALVEMLANLFWGGLTLAGLFLVGMAFLFLSA